MSTLKDIESRTREYAVAYEHLSSTVEDLESTIRELKRSCMPAIKRAAERAAYAKQQLRLEIEAGRSLFEKPRTRLMHGVKIGLQKGKGEIDVPNCAKTIELIRRHLADQADALIKVQETPIKKALANLPAADLKRIGVTVIETGDQVVISIAGTDVERLVDALLDDGEDEARAA